MKYIELNHKITDGMVTYPGDPSVQIGSYMTFEECGKKFGEKNAALLDKISMVNLTGTYVDAPVHRFPGRYYVSEIPLEKLADLQYEVIKQKKGKRCFELEDVEGHGISGGAVLFYTGMSETFNTPAYGVDAGYISVEAAQYLIDRGVVLVGIDTPLVDKMEGYGRPVHDIVLNAGGVVCEDMANLKAVCDLENKGTLNVIPARVRMASFTARAYVKIDE